MSVSFLNQTIDKLLCHREELEERRGDPVSIYRFSGLLRRFTYRNGRKWSLLIISLVFMSVLFSWNTAYSKSLIPELYEKSNLELEECVSSLPVKYRQYITNKRARLIRGVSKKLRNKINDCFEKKRIRDDVQEISDLKNVLKALHKKQSIENKELLDREAETISYVLVTTTRKLNEKYRMTGSSLWHNFLIKVGSKDGGYCYHWTENLLKSLPNKPMSYFERHWGVHSQGKVTENNAVIITKRGATIQEGIVYDPWRGKGRVFWKYVKDDWQSWNELYNEYYILYDQM